jgi:hypothetical protein
MSTWCRLVLSSPGQEPFPRPFVALQRRSRPWLLDARLCWPRIMIPRGSRFPWRAERGAAPRQSSGAAWGSTASGSTPSSTSRSASVLAELSERRPGDHLLLCRSIDGAGQGLSLEPLERAGHGDNMVRSGWRLGDGAVPVAPAEVSAAPRDPAVVLTSATERSGRLRIRMLATPSSDTCGASEPGDVSRLDANGRLTLQIHVWSVLGVFPKYSTRMSSSISPYLLKLSSCGGTGYRTVVRVNPASWNGTCVNGSSHFANSAASASEIGPKSCPPMDVSSQSKAVAKCLAFSPRARQCACGLPPAYRA